MQSVSSKTAVGAKPVATCVTRRRQTRSMRLFEKTRVQAFESKGSKQSRGVSIDVNGNPLQKGVAKQKKDSVKEAPKLLTR